MKIERLLTAAEESGDLEVYSEEIKEATNMVSDGVSKSLSQLLNIQNTVVTKFLDFALGLLLALVVFFVGLKLIRIVTKAVDKGFQKRNMDLTLQRFLLPLITYTLRILLAIIVISMLGLPVSSLVALLGAAGVAVGLAMQGGLSNFAGGIMILFVKPFKVGDYIQVSTVNQEGTVEEIGIFNTSLRTPDNKRIIIPNGNMSSSCVMNYSAFPERRGDLVFTISYSADLDHVRSVITEVLKQEDYVLQDKDIFVGVKAYGDSSVELMAWAWVLSKDFLTASYDIKEKVKKAFDRENIEIPYPQLDVHIKAQ